MKSIRSIRCPNCGFEGLSRKRTPSRWLLFASMSFLPLAVVSLPFQPLLALLFALLVAITLIMHLAQLGRTHCPECQWTEVIAVAADHHGKHKAHPDPKRITVDYDAGE